MKTIEELKEVRGKEIVDTLLNGGSVYYQREVDLELLISEADFDGHLDCRSTYIARDDVSDELLDLLKPLTNFFYTQYDIFEFCKNKVAALALVGDEVGLNIAKGLMLEVIGDTLYAWAEDVVEWEIEQDQDDSYNYQASDFC